MGDIDNVAPSDPGRVQFNALHIWSTRLESGVLLLGLVVVYLTAAQLKATAQVPPDFRAKNGKYAAYELRYWNYSVLMNTQYRTAWFSAANVDGAARPALPGSMPACIAGFELIFFLPAPHSFPFFLSLFPESPL